MRVLSITHGPDVRPELFGDVTRAEGHELDEWSIVDDPEPPRPLTEYDAVLVFGGQMNVDQEAEHPWLVREDELIRELVARGVPLLGICLGGQLLAKALGAHVGPSPEPEAGFVRATLTSDAADDPIFGALGTEADFFSCHGYAFEVPDGAVELARSRVCSQAFRVGDAAWGLQFHPEVRAEQAVGWLNHEPRYANADHAIEQITERIDEWQAFGARLCRAFLAEAEKLVSVH
jgi:GMP synthase-like glutamine amidotransferase